MRYFFYVWFIIFLLLGCRPMDNPRYDEKDVTDTIFCTIDIDSAVQIVFLRREIVVESHKGIVDTSYCEPKLKRGSQIDDIAGIPDNFCGFLGEYYISRDHKKVILPLSDCGWASDGDTTWWHSLISYCLLDFNRDTVFIESVAWDEDRYGCFDVCHANLKNP